MSLATFCGGCSGCAALLDEVKRLTIMKHELQMKTLELKVFHLEALLEVIEEDFQEENTNQETQSTDI
jgi:hypothetical protein